MKRLEDTGLGMGKWLRIVWRGLDHTLRLEEGKERWMYKGGMVRESRPNSSLARSTAESEGGRISENGSAGISH